MPITKSTAGVPTASRRDPNSHTPQQEVLCAEQEQNHQLQTDMARLLIQQTAGEDTSLVNLLSLTLTKLNGDDDPEAYLITLDQAWERSTELCDLLLPHQQNISGLPYAE